jgi:hypothetical protein
MWQGFMKKKLLKTEHFSKSLEGQSVYIDNDFLSFVFKYIHFYEEIRSLLEFSTVLIDPFTEFEFLRDIYDPKMRTLREQFLRKAPFHLPSPDFPLQKGTQENALILSKIYALKGRSKGISFVDLMLSGRAMAQKKALILSGNKKDFPSFVFEAKGVLNFEDDGISENKSFWLVSYSEQKFTLCYQHLKEVEKFQSKELSKTLMGIEPGPSKKN